MSLAIVSEISRRFKAVLAKFRFEPSEPIECRFLLRNGFYVGHSLKSGEFHGTWLSDTGELKVYRGQQWLLTLPAPLAELVDPSVPGDIGASSIPMPAQLANQTAVHSKSAA
jgi:hypothetical protein